MEHIETISMHEKGNGHTEPIKVLMYHRIIADDDPCREHWSLVHAHRFRKHLELLDQWGFTPITLSDYRLSLQLGIDLPARPVIITIDDGYMDTYTTAAPILQEFGMKAVVFVLGDRKIKSNYWDERNGVPYAPLMEGGHIRELHEAGFEIGAHSMSHPALTEIHEDDAWEEISRPRLLLEGLLGSPVPSFAYPYGLTNRIVKNLTEQAGYSLACSVGSGPAMLPEDPLEIRRITISNAMTSAGLALRLTTPYLYYALFKHRVRESLAHMAL